MDAPSARLRGVGGLGREVRLGGFDQAVELGQRRGEVGEGLVDGFEGVGQAKAVVFLIIVATVTLLQNWFVRSKEAGNE